MVGDISRFRRRTLPGAPAHRRVLAAAAFAILLGTLLPGPIDGQIARDPRPLRSGIDMVLVTATVLDAEGQLVTGLPPEAFEIYEDGILQTIAQFTHERVPIGLGMLVDVSDSMFGQRILDARRTVERFLLELLNEDDTFFVMAFNHAPRLMTRWTNDPDVVRRALDELRPTGGTAIYDALLQSIPVVRQRTRQRAAIVVISDGADTASDASISDVRTALLRSDAFVYAIAIDSPKTQAINTRVNPIALGEITNQSGGHTVVVRDAEEMAAATARIAEELNSQYVLGYSSPKATDRKYHSIRVKIRGEGYRVRARNGYVGG
ncbi:MAG TPA: VWA domain-containing protein [Vicinamibacterales bacterium]|nr:VWA domain-containing protein [Vicinamibacterales bacterium]